MDQQRFIQLWDNLFNQQAANSGAQAWETIADYYALQDRFYHTGEHICFCLSQFDKIAPLLSSTYEVETALWFHDIVYEMDSDCNEASSAQLFCQLVGGNTVVRDIRDRVAQLIMDTTHKEPPSSADGGYLADIDISSIGLPWEEFLKDSLNVRKESPHLSDAEYQDGQRCFFEGLLSKPSIFYTEYFRLRYERQARFNLHRLLNHRA